MTFLPLISYSCMPVFEEDDDDAACLTQDINLESIERELKRRKETRGRSNHTSSLQDYEYSCCPDSQHMWSFCLFLFNCRRRIQLFSLSLFSEFPGQMVSSEILMASESGCPIEMHKIEIAKCDEMFDRDCKGGRKMPFHRAVYDSSTGQSPNLPREQVSQTLPSLSRPLPIVGVKRLIQQSVEQVC